VFAQAFKVVGAVGGNVIKAAALALGSSARRLLSRWIEVVVVLKFMVAETFGLRTDHFAVLSPLVSPGQVQSVLGLLGDGQTYWLANVHLLQLLRRYIHSLRNAIITNIT
jgi:hypothetical protein